MGYIKIRENELQQRKTISSLVKAFSSCNVLGDIKVYFSLFMVCNVRIVVYYSFDSHLLSLVTDPGAYLQTPATGSSLHQSDTCHFSMWIILS